MPGPRILVFGKSGQVATALARASAPFEVTALGRGEADLSTLDTIAAAIAAVRPAAVINAAAYTAVDAAEGDVAAAYALNRDAPAAMARVCADIGAPFVHISTDFVFDGTKGAPYLEADRVAPRSVYGASKAEGEAAVLAAGGGASIVRTSWVYAATGKNFVRTMLNLAATRDELRVVADQRGRPTFAPDLADALLKIAGARIEGDDAMAGFVHYANSGEAVWADLAEAAIEGGAARGLRSVPVTRITTAEFPTPARRPANSRLDIARFTRWAGQAPPQWTEALSRCLDEIYVKR